MLKAITHFEQVPLGIVMEIVERDRRSASEDARDIKKLNLEARLPAEAAANVEAEGD